MMAKIMAIVGWTYLEELSRDVRSRRFDVHKKG